MHIVSARTKLYLDVARSVNLSEFILKKKIPGTLLNSTLQGTLIVTVQKFRGLFDQKMQGNTLFNHSSVPNV